jgi:hypothetical protein
MKLPRKHVITRYGDKCVVLTPGTREGAPAKVRRLRDGWEFDLFWEDMQNAYFHRYAFYGLTPALSDYAEQTRLSRIVRKFSKALGWFNRSHK